MLISYNWLRELTGTTMTPLELRERLTMVGLAIDAVDDVNGDSVLDVEVPSNRPDCLSHIGIGREVAVIQRTKLRLPETKGFTASGKSADLTSVEIADADLCPRYAARIVRSVRIAPSPDWLQKRLGEIGQRRINNVADITNYVLHETGQPLHAFDLAKLGEQRIIVRRARAGESLKTLDGVDRKLDTDMLVIADAKEPVALAGIMGGLESEISESTVDVLIESAYFNPDSVRRTARRLGMDTEASRRFERGADCGNVLRAQTRCVELICEIAGGTATEDAIDVYPKPAPNISAGLRPPRVKGLTSVDVETPEIERILTGLGFTETSRTAEAIVYSVPSWRVDIALEEDLVEEVVRHVGYDKIGSELPPTNLAGEYQPSESQRRALRRAFAAVGFDEAIDLSFIDTEHDGQFELLPDLKIHDNSSDSAGFVTLKNPIIEEARRMRPTLIPGLLESVRRNLNHGNRNVLLFEIGRVFAGSGPGELPQEREALAVIATGDAVGEGYAQAVGEIDFLYVKGALEAAIEATKFGPLVFANADVKHLRRAQSAKLTRYDGRAVGTLGRLAESIAASYKFRQPVFIGEIDLTTLFESQLRSVQYRPLPRYPSVVRDVTLLVDRNVQFSSLVHAIDSRQISDYAGVSLVGVYEGKNIPTAKRSVTLRLEYRSDERTLRDEEVDQRHRQLVESLVSEFHAEQH